MFWNIVLGAVHSGEQSIAQLKAAGYIISALKRWGKGKLCSATSLFLTFQGFPAQ